MAEPASGQEERNPAFWLATRAGNMGSSCPLRISRIGPARKNYLFGYIINSLLTKLVRSRWLYIGSFFFAFLMNDFDLACENIRFSSFFVAGDVSRGSPATKSEEKRMFSQANPDLTFSGNAEKNLANIQPSWSIMHIYCPQTLIVFRNRLIWLYDWTGMATTT